MLTGKRNSKHEDGLIEMIFYEKEKEKIMKKIEQNLKNLCDTATYTNIHIMGFPGGKERENKERILGRIMAIQLPNLMKNTNLHIQEAQ